MLAAAALFAASVAPSVHAAPASVARQFGGDIADAVEKVMPSVVVIRTEATKYHITRDMFWGTYYRIPERLVGQGSGVIITKDGYILTNNHVIEGAGEIEVVLNDGTKYPAKLVGREPFTDLAVVKIQTDEQREFVPLEAGDSEVLRVGEFVIAIGSPFSLSSSVTLGIVSQKQRSLGLLPYEDFIQHDAAVNQGNSGGPLVDIDGRMVGINTLIHTTSGGNIGISFAVPANVAMSVARSIIEKGRWERPWLGISMTMTPAGVVAEEIVGNAPADKAGMRAGDRIIEIEGAPVNTPRDVQRAVLRHRIGDTIELKIVRGDEEQVVSIATETMPEMQ
jgi:S1-C subfamily serine protease